MPSENRSCRYQAGFVCFYTGECKYPDVITCLQQNLFLAQKEISLLKERRNLKHSKVSLKWRDTAFYYKKKNKLLEDWIKGKGLKVPTVDDLFKSGAQETALVKSTKTGGQRARNGQEPPAPVDKEAPDERICDVNKETARAGGGDSGGNQVGDSSNKPSG